MVVLPDAYVVVLALQPVAVGIVLFGALLAWILPCGWGAKDWFRGEKHNLEDPSVGRLACSPYRFQQMVSLPDTLFSHMAVPADGCDKNDLRCET